MTMEFSISVRLGYRVEQHTPFVFNVQAQRFAGQEIVSEELKIDPGLPLEHWIMPESGNRYFRLTAPSDRFLVSYNATVRLSHDTEDPDTVHEVPAGELPLSVLTHLYPSRYCQADRLQRFAHRAFDAVPPGHQRVAAATARLPCRFRSFPAWPVGTRLVRVRSDADGCAGRHRSYRHRPGRRRGRVLHPVP